MIIDQLSNLNYLVNRLKSKYGTEEIVFASAATILETTSTQAVGWSWKRLFQRRGVVIFTDRRLHLQASTWSVATLLYVILILLFILQFSRTGDLLYLLLCGLAVPFILQRLPYQRDILLEDIPSVMLGLVQGATARATLLTVTLGSRAIQVVPAQRLPPHTLTRLFPGRLVE